jgi:hypothetical protein
METYTKITGSFKIYDFEADPDEISNFLGMTPSRCWRTGDIIKTSTMKRKSNCWIIDSECGKEISIDLHIRNLLIRLDCIADKFLVLPYDVKSCFSFAIYSYNGDRPSLFMEHDIISGIAKYNANLDLDLYIL